MEKLCLLRRRGSLLISWVLLCIGWGTSQWAVAAPVKSQDQEALIVMAAASLSSVLPKVAAAWKAQGGRELLFSFDATSRLARQVTAGAPADLFFSADQEWMDYLEKGGKIKTPSRRNLLANRLMVVVPVGSSFVPQSAGELVSPALKFLALAGESVPAGKYARAALQSEKVLEKLQERVVNADHVRAALHWVAKKEVSAGIVFQTDAIMEPKVQQAFVFPEKSHPKIEYPAAVLKESQHAEAGKDFLDFCHSTVGRKMFIDAGFEVL